jgi:sortase A
MQLRIGSQTFFPARTGSLRRWGRYVFFAIGVLALGYYGFILVDARLYQAYQTSQFDQALKETRLPAGSGEEPKLAVLPPASAESEPAKAEETGIPARRSGLLGRIEMGRIGLAAMIMEGIDETTLRRAVGHIPDTALPGQRGNIALAGHRDTFFRALRNIHADDEITVKTLVGSYRYQVDSTKVVDPEDTEVLDGGNDETLTLVTCFPFDFVGHAPKRFIVRAHRIPGAFVQN